MKRKVEELGLQPVALKSSTKEKGSTKKKRFTLIQEKSSVKEERLLEFKWTTYGTDNSDRDFSMFEDEFEGHSLGISRAIRENDAGEEHQYSLTICLVDGRSADRNVLAEVGVDFWPGGANLYDFTNSSQDHADFCRAAWASGEHDEEYPGQDIELGECDHSWTQVAGLVEASEGIWFDDVMYLQHLSLNTGSTWEDGRELMDCLFEKLDFLAIIHGEHLRKTESEDDEDIRFRPIGDGWLVGPFQES